MTNVEEFVESIRAKFIVFTMKTFSDQPHVLAEIEKQKDLPLPLFTAYVKTYILPFENKVDEYFESQCNKWSIDRSTLADADVAKFKRFMKCFCDSVKQL